MKISNSKKGSHEYRPSLLTQHQPSWLGSSKNYGFPLMAALMLVLVMGIIMRMLMSMLLR